MGIVTSLCKRPGGKHDQLAQKRNEWAKDVLNKFVEEHNKLLPISEKAMFKSSIAYLQRDDVQRQFMDIIAQKRAISMKHRFGKVLDIIYLEIQIKCTNGDTYNLNFWPCSTCACIAVTGIYDY